MQHVITDRNPPAAVRAAGGVAVADVNGDGWPDFYALTGQEGAGTLMLNQGDGSFRDATPGSGLDVLTHHASGPLFFYFDSDALPDFVVGSADYSPPRLFRNLGDGKFTEVFIWLFAGMEGINTTSITAADIDLDGDSDLFLTHWQEPFLPDHFFLNDGGRDFLLGDKLLGFGGSCGPTDHSFTANFRDLNGDDYPDLLLTGDFGCTQLWMNERGQRFVQRDPQAFTDQNGMGAAIGDFDNDGDEDWFVSAIYDDDGILEGNWSGAGNRLYENIGQGTLRVLPRHRTPLDAGWGWGSTLADLDLDGWLDLAVVNGWPKGSKQFYRDATKIFMGDAYYPFREQLYLGDSLQGRGVSAFDYDLDGDLDLLIANYDGPLRLFRNEHPNPEDHLVVQPLSDGRPDVGARVVLHSSQGLQQHTISTGSNYCSQNMPLAHFGIGPNVKIDSVVVYFTTGATYTLLDPVKGTTYRPSADAISVVTGRALTVRPNPVRVDSRIEVQRPSRGQGRVTVYDLFGRERAKLKLTERTAEIDTFTFSTGDELVAGQYVVVYTAPGSRFRIVTQLIQVFQFD